MVARNDGSPGLYVSLESYQQFSSWENLLRTRYQYSEIIEVYDRNNKEKQMSEESMV